MRVFLIFISLLMSLLFGYGAGYVFDMAMHTHALPIFICASIVLGLSFQTSAYLNSQSFGQAMVIMFVTPFVSTFGMLLANLMFESEVKSFMLMIGYTDSAYILAFAGSGLMAIASLLSAALTGIFIAIVGD